MSKYAFLVHGDESEFFQLNDRIRLRRHGAWLIAEKIQQSKMAKRQARQMLSAVQLAKKISDDKQITIEEAFGLLQTQGEADSAMLLSDYQEEATRLMDNGMSREEQDSALITIFMRTRGQALIRNEWKSLSDWSEGDTEMLTGGMSEKLLTFIFEEQAGGKLEEDGEEFDPPTVEEADMGKAPEKSSASSGNASRSSSKKTTGMASTPDSLPLESPMETSVEKTSEEPQQEQSPLS